MLRTAAIASLTLVIGAADPTELNFGIIATESTQNLKKDWDPVRADLEKSLAMPVKLFFAPDYAGIIEAMRFNKVQLAWFGNKSAIDAVDRGNGEVFAQCIDKDGNPGYWSLVIVHKDSPIQNLEQLHAQGKELTFSMGDPQSTSGTLVPGYFAFGKFGIDPQKHFKVCRNGNHESNALSVAMKQIDAATFNTEAMFHLERKHPEKAALIRPIWKSGLIASDPLVYRSDLNDGLKGKITTFFVGYGASSEGKAKLEPLKLSGFRASNNNQLLPYRHLGLLKDRSKLEADDKIPAAEKQGKIAELSAKIADLEKQMAAVAAKAPAQ